MPKAPLLSPSPPSPSPPPSRRVRRRRARRRLLFAAIRIVLRAAGFARAGAIGRAAGELQYRLGGETRRRIVAEVAAVLGRGAGGTAVGPGSGDAERVVREAYRQADAAVFEMIAMLDRKPADSTLRHRCEVGGVEHLRAALDGGRGAIVLGSHMGNAALLVARLALEGFAVSVVFREAHMRAPGFLEAGIERYGVEAIVANSGIRAYGRMLAALRQGRVVFVMLDQGTRRAADGIAMPFLGKRMPMPAGPAQLARTAKAPVLPVAALAAEPAWRFAIGPPLALPGSSLEADLAALVDVTERNVRAHPDLWTWHHRRWRNFPLAAPVAPGLDTNRPETPGLPAG